MGNETSARALLHNLEDLEAALREVDTSGRDHSKHGWDTRDCSSNIQVLDGGLKIRRGSQANQSDAVRGRCLYSNGVHFFEFTWSGAVDSTKIVSVGVATQAAGLTAKGGRVLGSTDQSVAFDLLSNTILFNGCPVKTYPPNKPRGFKVPPKVTMILDMDNGTLGFKANGEDFGHAMTGLRHMSDELCIAAELNKSQDELMVKYKGSSEEVEGPRVPPTPGTPGSRRGTHEAGRGMRGPKTSDDFQKGLQKMIEELKLKDKSRVDQAKEMVYTYMVKGFSKIGNGRLKRLAGEQLAAMGGAKVITEYHNFLVQNCKSNGILSFLITLRSACQNFAHYSLVLCTKFGESGFVEALIKEITGKSRTYTDDDDMTKQMVTSAFDVLHNCSKSTENKPIFRKNRFIQEAKPYTHPDYHSVGVVMTSLFAMSYVSEEREAGELILGRRIAKEVVDLLSKAVANKNHEHSGWGVCELAVAMSNLAANGRNGSNLVNAGAIPPLVKMLDGNSNYEKECALNAIWSLTNDYTKVQVSTTDGLLTKLDQLSQSSHEDVKQAAVRLQMKLTDEHHQQKGGAATGKRDCQFADLCKRFKDSLGLDAAYFNEEFNTCFCAKCHGARGDKSKYSRGKPPKYYGVPVGWYKFGLKEPPKAKPMKVFQEWHRAFHGTVKDYLKGILNVGEIVPAGRAVLGGKNIKERPGHFCDGRKPSGFDTKQLFLSPSMRYSGIDTYAKPSRFQDRKSGKTYNAKVAFQVLIAPGSYKVGPETIGARSEIDPDFRNQEMEWSTNQQGCHILSGLLVKLY